MRHGQTRCRRRNGLDHGDESHEESNWRAINVLGNIHHACARFSILQRHEPRDLFVRLPDSDSNIEITKKPKEDPSQKRKQLFRN